MSTDSIQLQIVKNAGAPAIGAIIAAFSDTIVLGLGSTSSGVKRVKYRIYEFPTGFALPTGWTQEAANCYSVTVANGGDAPIFSLPASGISLRGKYFFDAVANDQLSNGAIVGGLRSKAQLKIPMATAGLEDVGYLESNEFDAIRQAAGALKAAIRILDQAVLSGGGVTAHSALTGLAGDDHLEYEFAARPAVAYTSASNDLALADARKCAQTTRATAISLRIRLQASIAWLADTLHGGINLGAGTLTITAEAGVTLNGSVTVAQNGWWWAKRTALNTWSVFTGGTGGGAGDFKADGTVTATGDFNLGTHKITGGAAASASTDFTIKSQLDAVATAALQRDGSNAATGDLNLGGNQISNAGDAAASTDLTTLQQVNALIAAAIAGAGGGGGDGFSFTFDTATGDADPTSGKLRYNNATLASVTQIFVDLLDVSNNDLTGWLDRLDDSLNAVKGYIRVGSKSSPTRWALFTLTGVTTTSGYRKLPVAFVTGGAGGLPNTTAGDTFLSFEAWGLPNTITDALVDAAAAIALSKLAQGTACSFVGRGANSTGALALITAGTNGFVALRRANVLTSGFILDENVDSAAGIAGTKIAPNFGSQTVITTNTYRGGTSPSTSGIFNAPNNVVVGAVRNAANSNDINIYYADGSDKIILGGSLATGIAIMATGTTGFDWDGSTALVGDQSFVGLEHGYPGSREVIALCRAAAISTTEMPTGSGSGVINIATETVAPTVKPNAGIVAHVSATLGLMSWSENNAHGVVAPRGTSTSRLRKFINVTKQGDVTTSGTTANQVVASVAPADIDGSALPNGGVVWVKSIVMARRGYNTSYKYGAEFKALCKFDSTGYTVLAVETITPIGDSTSVPTFNLIATSGTLQLVVTPATSDPLICFGVLRLDGDSDT